jgi:membrane protease YdiL (CAAX protease family)
LNSLQYKTKTSSLQASLPAQIIFLAGASLLFQLLLVPFYKAADRSLLSAATASSVFLFAFLGDILNPITFIIIALFFRSAFKSPTPKEIGWRPIPPDLLYGFLAFAFSTVALFFSPPTFLSRMPQALFAGPHWPVLLTQIAATFVIAFGEELLFRGILQNILSRYLLQAAAVAVASLVFGSLHCVRDLSLSRFLFATALGFALGLIYTRTHRLPTAVLVHAGANAALLSFKCIQLYFLSPQCF